MRCDPEEEEDGEPDVEALRFREQARAGASLSEQVSDRVSDVCGVWYCICMLRDKSHM